MHASRITICRVGRWQWTRVQYQVDQYDNPTTTSVIAPGVFGAQIQTNDVIELQVSGAGATVTLTLLVNGTVIATGTDTSETRFTAAGLVGLRCTSTGSDSVRAIWAGAIGGASEAITPSSATVALSGTQTFAFVGGLPGENFAGTATHGTFSGLTYTAPGSGLEPTSRP